MPTTARLGLAILGRSRLGCAPGGTSPPTTLVEAIEQILAGALAGAAGPLTWVGSGLAPPDTPLPYASYNEPDETDALLNTAGTKSAVGTIELQLFAATKSQARSLGDSVTILLEKQAFLGLVFFTSGFLYYLLGSGRSCTEDPDNAPGGGPCWIETRQFEFRYTYQAGRT